MILYFVRSSEQPDTFYAVAASGPTAILRCECPAGTGPFKSRKPCRHVREIIEGRARPARLKAA